MDQRVKRTIFGTAVAATALVVTLYLQYPPTLDGESLLAFGTLLALSTLAMMLYLRFTETGSTTSMDFVPELGAILLLGPTGAVTVTLLSELISGFFLYREKSVMKKLFNVSQLVLAVGVAGVLFRWSGGVESLTVFRFQSSLAPFLVAVLAYFAVNTSTVAFIVSVSERAPFFETWRRMTGGLIVFDLAMSTLAFLVAFLYTEYGVVAVFLAMIPLIGLRYSYGVNFELQQLNSDLLRLMVKTIEAQDPYTSGHSIRVSEAAKKIGRALGLNPRQLKIVETAALLHDIGKIDVVYGEILRQKGPLTPEQRELIRAHPDRGVDIIKSIRSIHPEVLACVRHHHERWDGDGYPAGLAGDEIPLGSRIIMVCDTIDAMTTARPYRDALPVSVVREELTTHRNTQFDSAIVDVLVQTDILETLDRPDPVKPTTSDRLAGISPALRADAG
jgi:putative nucleotidyltransferase with HDIG domain